MHIKGIYQPYIKLIMKNYSQETTASSQLQKIQIKQKNSENGHLVFSIFKKKQENNGVGDISSLLTMSLE